MSTLTYGSVCSGIEAATVAWKPLGFKASFFSEIEKFPRQVLAHHYPKTPLHGDFTTIQGDEYEPIDILVGGTPCQSFSVAGLRKGLDDPRGNLMLEFGALARRTRPAWLVWENVPGVLTSNGGRDFGSFLAMLGELGYGFAYRVLDAQYFGVPQRRKRVFVIGHLGNWQAAAAVLFERHSLQGHSKPSREARQSATAFIETGFADYRQSDTEGTSKASGGCLGGGGETLYVADVSAPLAARDYKGINTDDADEKLIVVHGTQDPCTSKTTAFALGRNNGGENVIYKNMRVRRLTPTECERLQGFPDLYADTNPNGKPTPDSPRYKALGNSMAVPVMAWIGKRLLEVHQILERAA